MLDHPGKRPAERPFDDDVTSISGGAVVLDGDLRGTYAAAGSAGASATNGAPRASLSDLPWGAHVCQFYASRQDLLEIVVPYFRAGLARRERCLWVVADPFSVAAATEALRHGIPDADRHLAAGDLEVVPHTRLYLDGGTFDARRVLEGWNAKLAEALDRGYTGLRVSGDETWLTEETRADFRAYERALDEALGGRRMIVLCTYPLEEGSTGAQAIDVARVHHYAVAKRAGEWAVIEVLALAAAQAATLRQKEELEQRVAERTKELAAANEELRRQMQDRERAEAALRESDELFHVLAENSSNIVTLFDAEGHRVYASPAAGRLLGEFSDDWFADIHPDDQDAVRAVWTRLRAGEPASVTVRRRRPDDGWLWLEAWGSPVEYRGAPHVLAIIRDVTDQVRAREEIRSRDARFRALVEHDDALIGILDERGHLVYVSPSYTRVLGYGQDELYAMDPSSLLHPEDLANAEEQCAQLERRQGFTLPRPVRTRTKDGRYRSFTVTVTDQRADPAIGGFIVNSRDVTDELLLEEQLRQAQKMEAIGRLAGGVAHDFNNLLTVIQGYSDFIHQASAPDDARRDDAEEIRRAADRAALLTQQLLAFSRKQVLQPRVLAINAVVDETSRMLRRLIGEDVTLDLRLAPDAGAVRADAGQLQQTLMNLAVNARDAMPLGGRLVIETVRVGVERDEPAQPAPLTPGRYVRLAVRDTGTGMRPDVLARAFEPFFTTKEPGKGTGLGLSTVYGIVTQSKGHLRVHSAPGQGTMFEIFFPSADAPAVATTPPLGTLAVRGAETVLLVEDDAMVRRLAETTLTRAGYHVLTAASGADALRLVTERDAVIALVITDVVMPGMPGPALAQRLEASHPGLRVLYMSGYADDTMARYGVNEERVSFLAKPFTPSVLAERVREVLDAERS
jgi:PAS domain S-box-containing protein